PARLESDAHPRHLRAPQPSSSAVRQLKQKKRKDQQKKAFGRLCPTAIFPGDYPRCGKRADPVGRPVHDAILLRGGRLRLHCVLSAESLAAWLRAQASLPVPLAGGKPAAPTH
ncbi:uncharacterized protein Tco025E_10134, partial [Trypanosoma conorhini]